MAEKKTLPTHAQLKKLLDMLLPPNEEMDEASAAIILEQAGVDRSTLTVDLKERLARKIEQLRKQGADVPYLMLQTLSNLELHDPVEKE